jgi:3D-(3,5/4)-trihydroxycyclohexane-1,2-dione acylhydrolase (decyclizing)
MRQDGKTTRLTVAQAVVRFLQVQYSRRDGHEQRLVPAIFGIFGHGNVAGLGQALYEHGSELPYLQPCNEQSMVHAATGFAKATNRRQTLACSSSIGPGATNMVTGAATATINRLPVLLLPSDYYATRRQGPVLQQLEHPVSFDVSVNDCFRPVSRFFDRIIRPEQLIESLPEAMRVLTDDAATGAVTIALPQDVQAEACEYPLSLFERRTWELERRPPSARAIDQVVALLREARRPFLVAGGGVHYSEAWAELRAFAEETGIPIGETFAGKGAVREPSRLLVGGVGVTGAPSAGAVARDADLVICVGTRLTDFTTGSHSLFQHPGVKLVSINVAGSDAFKMGALAVLADAREALAALREAARSAGVRPREEYLLEIDRINGSWREQRDDAFLSSDVEPMTQAQVIGMVNEHAQAGDTIVAAAGSPPGDLHQLWDATGGARAHLEFGFSCMGYEIPAGLGVRLTEPDGEVYVLIGDGTYLMNPTELKTAVQEGLKVTVVLVNNYGFQCIRRLQLARSGREFGNEFRLRDGRTNRLEGEYMTVDFAKNAEAFGCRAWSVDTPGALRAALREAREETRACVVVAEVQKHVFGPPSDVWWDVAPAEATDDEETRRLREAYEAERAERQRHYV